MKNLVQNPTIPSGGSLTVDTAAYGPSTVSITRPADTAAYTAGDVVSNSTSAPAVMEFENIGGSSGRVLLQSAFLRLDVSAVPGGMGSFRLHLYSTAPTAINDNAAFNLPAGDRSKYLGYVDFATPQDLGDTAFTQVDYIGKQVALGSGETSLYGILETRGAYTPGSATVLSVVLNALEVSK